MSESDAKVVPIQPAADFETRVLESLSRIERRIDDLEMQVKHCRNAIVVLTERVDRSHRALEQKIDALRVETEVLAQGAMGARLDMERAERVAAWAIQQRDEARRETSMCEPQTNGNGRYSSAPPPPEE